MLQRDCPPSRIWKLSTNSEHVHLRPQATSESPGAEQRFRYHRLNGMDDIGLQGYDRIKEIAMHTTAYLDERVGVMKTCVQDLMNPPPMECK